MEPVTQTSPVASVIAEPALAFPHPAPPAPGTLLAIAPGVLWLRLPLPYRLAM